MVRRRSLLAALTAAAVAGCAGIGVGVNSGAGSLQASEVAEGDRVAVRGKNKAPRVEISSGRGIGSATLAVAGGNWPARVTVMLYLDGLEGFEANVAGRKGQVEFSSRDEQVLVSPPVSLVTAAAREADAFALVLDTGALAFTDTMTLRWVDFYR